MGLYLFAAFVAVPIIEIALLIELGGVIGTPATIILVILTAAIGTRLLRQQGRAALARAQSELNQGRLPANEMFDGICLFAAGLLLLTPGLLTDIVGGLLLTPPFRRRIQKRAAAWFAKNGIAMTQNMYAQRNGAQTTHTGQPTDNPFAQTSAPNFNATEVDDGSYTVIKPLYDPTDTPPPAPNPDSGPDSGPDFNNDPHSLEKIAQDLVEHNRKAEAEKAADSNTISETQAQSPHETPLKS